MLPLRTGPSPYSMWNTSATGPMISRLSNDGIVSVDSRGRVQIWETSQALLDSSLQGWTKLIGRDDQDLQVAHWLTDIPSWICPVSCFSMFHCIARGLCVHFSHRHTYRYTIMGHVHCRLLMSETGWRNVMRRNMAKWTQQEVLTSEETLGLEVPVSRNETVVWDVDVCESEFINLSALCCRRKRHSWSRRSGRSLQVRWRSRRAPSQPAG